MGKIKGSYKEHLINTVEDLKSGEYVILSEDEFKYKDKVEMLHTTCGTIFYPTIKNFTNKNKGGGKGTRCPECSHPSKARTMDYVKEYFERVTLGEYTLLSTEYVNNKEKLKIRHNCSACNDHEFEMTFNEFKNAEQRCPECNRIFRSSKYHKYIRRFFQKFNIQFEEEKTFDTCKNKKNLFFDFYLPNYKLLIEYDGAQHSRAWYDDEEQLKKQKNNDDIKDKWVLDNEDYTLLRISCSMEILSNIMFGLFKEGDSTTIEKYNKNVKVIRSRVHDKQ